MGRKSNHLMERGYAHLSKNGSRKSGFLADPELTGTVLMDFIGLMYPIHNIHGKRE
jgi:hypothetical protein